MSPRRTTAGSQPRSAETGALPRHEACHWLGAAPTPRLSQIAHVEQRDHRRHARSSSKAVTPSRTGSGPRRRWNRTNPVTRGPVAVGCRDRAGAGSRTGSSMRTTGRLPRQSGFVRPTSRPSERRRSARRLGGRSRGERDRERVARSPRRRLVVKRGRMLVLAPMQDLSVAAIRSRALRWHTHGDRCVRPTPATSARNASSTPTGCLSDTTTDTNPKAEAQTQAAAETPEAGHA
jgi:hypothetical protein